MLKEILVTKKLFAVISAVFVLFIFSDAVNAQNNEKKDTVYQVYYYPNGQKSSEGYLVKGKPDLYWKNYYENGVLKSEGNRKNGELDSLWKFYDKDGKITLSVNYAKGKKNGIRTTYKENEIVIENFENDVKEGKTIITSNTGKIKSEIWFKNGREHGIAKEFAEDDGRIITIIEYSGGFIKNREVINRYNSAKQKNGMWKTFYPDGKVHLEEQYFNGKKDGFFKEYDTDGSLISVRKYINDELQEDAKETVRLEVRMDYWDNGNIKIYATYKDNVPQGIRREYSENGKIEKAYTIDKGIVTGEGIVDEAGLKQGPWKEYFENGVVSGEGNYLNGKRVGKWTFYYRTGKVEQIGFYDKNGLATGEWKWFYNNGNILREETLDKGKEEGIMKEYDIYGNVIVEGEYIEGLETGLWKIKTGDDYVEGYFKEGLQNGTWKHYYPNGKLMFEGNYFEDLPDGRHVYYWENGNIREEGNYVGYKRNGDWKKYNEDGTLLLIVTYKDDIEQKIEGVKLPPVEIEKD